MVYGQKRAMSVLDISRTGCVTSVRLTQRLLGSQARLAIYTVDFVFTISSDSDLWCLMVSEIDEVR